jgi:hypothetical protein
VDPVIGPVDGDESFAEISQSGFAGGSDLPFGHHHPCRSAIQIDHLAIADLVFQLAEAMDANGIAVDAPCRLLGHLDFGDQVADARIPSREFDTGGLADQAASAVATDDILRPQRAAVRQRDIHAGAVLRDTGHLDAAMDRYRQFCDPAGQDTLDVILPQPEPVIVPCGKVADVQSDAGERRHLRHLSLREEPIGDAPLIEHLDRARVQTARARAREFLVGASLDNRNIDARQRQLTRQHQSRWSSADDHHRVFDLCRTHSRLRSNWLRPAFYGMVGVLKQAPCALHI